MNSVSGGKHNAYLIITPPLAASMSSEQFCNVRLTSPERGPAGVAECPYSEGEEGQLRLTPPGPSQTIQTNCRSRPKVGRSGPVFGAITCHGGTTWAVSWASWQLVCLAGTKGVGAWRRVPCPSVCSDATHLSHCGCTVMRNPPICLCLGLLARGSRFFFRMRKENNLKFFVS